jgi:two-component system cell cycle sensor histidine kinase/response regulator CckA
MPIPFGRRSRPAATQAEFASRPVEPEPERAPQLPGGTRELIDAIDALVVVASPDGRILMWNQRCDHESGTPLTQLAGTPLWSVVKMRNSARAQAEAALERLATGAVPVAEFVAGWLRKDGRRARIRWSARLAWLGGESILVATGTEAVGHRAARDLAETERRFEKLLEVLPDPVVVHQDGRLVFVNKAAVEMYGADSAEHMCSEPVIERVAQESRAVVVERMHRMLALGEDVPMVRERHLRMDGSEFEAEVFAAPVMFGGRPAVEVLARDVTVRNKTEAALRESEARVRAVFDQSALGMVLTDMDGLVLESNSAFQRLLGYTGDELRLMRNVDYTHPDDREASARLLEDLFEGRRDRYALEKRYMTVQGKEVWVRVHVEAVGVESGPLRLAVATVEDISQSKDLEDQLRQASKMEALGRLASGVAHDFNNLLTVVNGYADLLMASLEPGSDGEASARQIRTAGARASELTAQLLAFGRKQSQDLERIDLNSRIEALLPMVRRLLGEDIDLSVELDRSVRAVRANGGELDQVVMNLIVNGRDAMPGGGSMTLATKRIEGAGSNRGEPFPWARIEIADTGYGMESEVLEHIFEPFFTTKARDKGTGLGLAIVYRIVEQMGGIIHVESRLGEGSRFIVDLPEFDIAGARPDVNAAAQSAGEHGHETILVVEDETAVRELCFKILTRDGYRVRACGPDRALQVAEELGSSLDLLLTDVVMPDVDGPTLAAALRSRRPSLPVLFMSGYPRNREEELTGAAAEGSVLAKPFENQQLCAAVRRTLDRGIGKP